MAFDGTQFLVLPSRGTRIGKLFAYFAGLTLLALFCSTKLAQLLGNRSNQPATRLWLPELKLANFRSLFSLL